jgi:hypothetical protein
MTRTFRDGTLGRESTVLTEQDWTLAFRKASRNTARIARTVINVVICRTFLRSVYGVVYRPLMDHYRLPSQIPPADPPHGTQRFAGLSTL